VIICPTDTVYGFLADAGNKKAVDKIYNIKKRPRSKPLSVFVRSVAEAKKIAFIDVRQEKILKKYWPGKYTFILRRKPGLKLYGLDKKTVAVRVPHYPFLLKLLKKIQRPLAQTSVNISGQAALKNAEAIIAAFEKNKQVGLLINVGTLQNAKPSKIIDITGEKSVSLR
jgi:L-threonylcarbamoyladenylate synthase